MDLKGITESQNQSTWQRSRLGGKIRTDRFRFNLDSKSAFEAQMEEAGTLDYDIAHDGNSPSLIAQVRVPELDVPEVPISDEWTDHFNETQQNLWLQQD